MNANQIIPQYRTNQELAGQLSFLRGISNTAGPMNSNNVVKITKSTYPGRTHKQ